jgi:hypothetical protein
MSASAYKTAVAERNELNRRIGMVEETYRSEMRRLKIELERENQVIRVAEAGFNAEEFVVARSIVKIEWGRQRHPRQSWDSTAQGPRRVTAETHQQLMTAIEKFREDDLEVFDTHYLGIKSYDRWNSQIEDHQHGMGPRHGSIWWRLALHRKPENEDETLACISWLRALDENPELLP